MAALLYLASSDADYLVLVQLYGAGGGGGDQKLLNWHCFFNAVSCFRRRRNAQTGHTSTPIVWGSGRLL